MVTKVETAPNWQLGLHIQNTETLHSLEQKPKAENM